MISRKPHLRILPQLLPRDPNRFLQQPRPNPLMSIPQLCRPRPDYRLPALQRFALLLAPRAARSLKPQNQSGDDLVPEFRADEEIVVACFGVLEEFPCQFLRFREVWPRHHAHRNEHSHAQTPGSRNNTSNIARDFIEYLVDNGEHEDPDGACQGMEDYCFGCDLALLCDGVGDELEAVDAIFRVGKWQCS